MWLEGNLPLSAVLTNHLDVVRAPEELILAEAQIPEKNLAFAIHGSVIFRWPRAYDP
jgi:hypothetical protein